MSELSELEKRIDVASEKLDEIEKGLKEVNEEFDKLEIRINELDKKIKESLDEREGRLGEESN